MTDGRHDIIETVVADIAMRRAVPDVFLLNDAGRPTAWPVGASELLPPSLQTLVDMYFAQGAAFRGILTELVHFDDKQISVLIVPHLASPADLYAMIVEPFVIRARTAQGFGELTTT